MKGLRVGAVALVAGGALTAGLLFGGALVSAQTPAETPAAEDEDTPADATTPEVAPDSDETPADSTQDANKGTDSDDADDSDATPSDGERGERDGECDKDGDGEPDAGMSGGTRFGRPGFRGETQVQ